MARACDTVVEDAGGVDSEMTVEQLINGSGNSKARLLHYVSSARPVLARGRRADQTSQFPPEAQSFSLAPSSTSVPEGPVDDSWYGIDPPSSLRRPTVFWLQSRR